MTTIAITPAQLPVLTWVLDIMREYADDDADCDYTGDDVPVLTGEDAPRQLNFSTDNRDVVEDLV